MGICGSLGFAALYAAFFVLAPELILRLLTSHNEIVVLTVSYRWWLVPVLLFGALAVFKF